MAICFFELFSDKSCLRSFFIMVIQPCSKWNEALSLITLTLQLPLQSDSFLGILPHVALQSSLT